MTDSDMMAQLRQAIKTDQVVLSAPVQAMAYRHFAAQVPPLLNGPLELGDTWVRELCESYRTEPRPESPGSRSAEIVAWFPERYTRLSEIVLPRGAGNVPELPDVGRLRQAEKRWRTLSRGGRRLGIRAIKPKDPPPDGVNLGRRSVTTPRCASLKLSGQLGTATLNARHHSFVAKSLLSRIYSM